MQPFPPNLTLELLVWPTLRFVAVALAAAGAAGCLCVLFERLALATRVRPAGPVRSSAGRARLVAPVGTWDARQSPDPAPTLARDGAPWPVARGSAVTRRPERIGRPDVPAARPGARIRQAR